MGIYLAGLLPANAGSKLNVQILDKTTVRKNFSLSALEDPT